METAWKLLETCIQPIITYGGETWNMTKKEEKLLNQIQENIVKRILMTPISTPPEALYIETGLLDVSTIIKINRINMEKRLLKNPNHLTTKIMNVATKGGWKETTERIKEELNITGNNTDKRKNKEKPGTYILPNQNNKPGKGKNKSPIHTQQ